MNKLKKSYIDEQDTTEYRWAYKENDTAKKIKRSDRVACGAHEISHLDNFLLELPFIWKLVWAVITGYGLRFGARQHERLLQEKNAYEHR